MKFAYTAASVDGKTHRGALEASSRNDAILELREKGLYVTQIGEAKGFRNLMKADANSWMSIEIHLGAKVKSGEFAIFARQLSTLIRAGVTIGDAVEVLAKQTENKTFAKALVEVSRNLQQGNQLSQAAGSRPDIFPNVFINMTRAGEASGHLDDVLDRMATFFEREHYTREKVKSALTYPIVVLVLSIAVTAFLLIKIVPTFVSMFASFNAQLPLPTRIVMGVSHFMVSWWYFILALLIGFVIAYKSAMRKESGRLVRDTILLKLPIFGELFRKSVMGRMGRTMSTLFASAVPVLQSLQLTSDVVQNAVVARALKRCSESLSGGQSISEPFEKEWVFPPLVVHMIKIGEETGNLDHMLTKIAEFYEAETEAMVDRLKSLIEPLMILFLTAIVGTIITAVITPMFSLYSQVGNMS